MYYLHNPAGKCWLSSAAMVWILFSQQFVFVFASSNFLFLSECHYFCLSIQAKSIPDVYLSRRTFILMVWCLQGKWNLYRMNTIPLTQHEASKTCDSFTSQILSTLKVSENNKDRWTMLNFPICFSVKSFWEFSSILEVYTAETQS